MRTTIKDVAKAAGYSTTTVSMVLNNRPVSISQKTRDIILQTAKDLHYRPNQLAVGLVTKKTNTLGLIIPDNSNLFFASYTNQIESAAREYGYSVILGNTNNSYDYSQNYLQMFADRGVDGIIFAQSEFESEEESKQCLELIQYLKVPIILVDRISKTLQPTLEHVILDHFHGGYIATKHLLDLNHRRIGCITGPMGLTNSIQRLEGHKAALAERGIPFDESLIFEGDLLISGGIEGLPFILGQNVTAIFAFNDMTAYGIYKELRRYDLSIPKDISVIGFDDLFFSDVLDPPLTTMAQPMDEMAKEVIIRLVGLIENKQNSSPIAKIFQPVLKVRGSTRRLEKN